MDGQEAQLLLEETEKWLKIYLKWLRKECVHLQRHLQLLFLSFKNLQVYFLQCRRDFGLLHLEQTEKECLSQLARVTQMAAR